MVKKKARLYKTRSDGFKYVLYPKTHSSCITISDGKTVQDKLSTVNTNMFTPVIEASLKMFKIGVGDSVDLSSSAVDGAYDSCVLKGRTLVNLHPKRTYKILANTTEYFTDVVSEENNASVKKTDGALSWCYGNAGILDKTLFKPSTKYLVVFEKTENVGDVAFSNGTATQAMSNWKALTNNRVVLTTTSTIPTDDIILYVNHNGISNGKTFQFSNAMILEYQDGMENWDISYFTGMCDVKSPILSNCGKNLINPALFKFQPNLSGDGSEKVESVGDDIIFYGANKGYYLDVILKENTSYYINYESRSDVTNIRLFDLDGWQINNLVPNTLTTDIQQNTIITTNKKCRIRVWTEGSVAIIRKLIVAEATQAVPYEPYKSNILTCETYFDEVSQSDKTIVLRSLPSGVCDTLNVETGEYVQRIGEVVLDGSDDEDWINNTVWSGGDYFASYSKKACVDKAYGRYNIVADKYANVVNLDSSLNQIIGEGVFGEAGTVYIYVCVAKSKLATADKAGFKAYLQSNPITVQYQLATPIVKTVNLSGFPYAYKDGHVILESGSVEQSLTPIVEYSLISNKAGAITTNTKMTNRHQKELDELETLVSQFVGTEVIY